MNTDEGIALLSDKRSAKRRSGAKNLRRLQDPGACPELLMALEKEVLDPRTWETQYQMVMALGECGCSSALPALEQLAEQVTEGKGALEPMVYTAVGDALVRLGRKHDNDPLPV